MLTNQQVKTNCWHIKSDNCVELRYSKDMNCHIEVEFGSEITAAFTTANARTRLNSMLLWLDPTQLIYCDTDSVIFRYDPENEKHKYPKNDEIGIPDNVRFGDALGEWENEFGED